MCVHACVRLSVFLSFSFIWNLMRFQTRLTSRCAYILHQTNSKFRQGSVIIAFIVHFNIRVERKSSGDVIKLTNVTIPIIKDAMAKLNNVTNINIYGTYRTIIVHKVFSIRKFLLAINLEKLLPFTFKDTNTVLDHHCEML